MPLRREFLTASIFGPVPHPAPRGDAEQEPALVLLKELLIPKALSQRFPPAGPSDTAIWKEPKEKEQQDGGFIPDVTQLGNPG